MASLLAPSPSPLLPRSGASGGASGAASGAATGAALGAVLRADSGGGAAAGAGAGAGDGAITARAARASGGSGAAGAAGAAGAFGAATHATGTTATTTPTTTATAAATATATAKATATVSTAGLASTADTQALRAAVELPLSRQPGQQQRVGRLQQGLDYLDRLASSVQQVKRGLSDTLARRTAPSESLNQQVEQLRQLWSQRPDAAAGRVDAQLQAADNPDTSARQRFKLRGLDLTVLQQPGRETLRLQLPGQAVPQGDGTSAKPVQLAVTLQGEGTQEQLQVLAKALAPAGLELMVQGQDIIFQMAEAQWPALRDGLTVRGDGKRFPSGQPVRAMLEPAPEALQPQRWTLQDTQGQREALGQLLQAEPRLAQARQKLAQQLDRQINPQVGQALRQSIREPISQPLSQPISQQVSPALGQPVVTNAEEAKDLVGDITSTMQSLDFQALGALLPAVHGLHRQRVQQLLTPR